MSTESTEAAERLLDKLARFVAEELDDEERDMFAKLLAPGVSLAYQTPPLLEVEMPGGSIDVDWRPSALPEALAEAMRARGVKVVGLGGEDQP
jgi:hypothetical protein